MNRSLWRLEEVDGGGGAPKLGDARKTKHKGTEGEKK